MFKLDPNPTFQVTVPITVPGGGSRPLAVVFRHRTKSQMNEWLKVEQGDLQMALDMIESIPDKGDDNTLQEFLQQLLEHYPASALDLFITYRRELLESRAKN